ncbi:MAG: 2-succinyl-6-hydroxy-2,4-cyclohexadiene-1-carboxylate synthase [Anaerolineae bacterium]
MTWPYRSLGVRQRPPVVFLHGFMGAGEDWLPIAGMCAGRYFCLLPDLPGHGRNIDLPLAQPLDFDFVVDGLRAWLDRLEPRPVGLVGYSMGGRLALYAALKFPGRFAALVLEGANPGLADPGQRGQRAELDAQRAEALLREGLAAFVEGWYEMDLFRSLQDRPQLLKQIKAKRKRNDARRAARVIRELSPGRQPPLWDRLDELSLPVLLVAGALDGKYSRLAAQMAARISGAGLAVVPGAGHNVHLEQPEQFAGALIDFLQKSVAWGDDRDRSG